MAIVAEVAVVCSVNLIGFGLDCGAKTTGTHVMAGEDGVIRWH